MSFQMFSTLCNSTDAAADEFLMSMVWGNANTARSLWRSIDGIDDAKIVDEALEAASGAIVIDTDNHEPYFTPQEWRAKLIARMPVLRASVQDDLDSQYETVRAGAVRRAVLADPEGACADVESLWNMPKGSALADDDGDLHNGISWLTDAKLIEFARHAGGAFAAGLDNTF